MSIIDGMGASNGFTELAGRLVCPDCATPLEVAPDSIRCTPCARAFPIREGIPSLLPKSQAEPEPAEKQDGTSAAYRQNYQKVERAERYNDKYRKQILKRASTGREFRLIAELLAPLGRSALLLDLPSGGGRLSPAMAPFAERIVEADVAFGQLVHGHAESMLPVPQLWLHASAFQIPLADRSVDGSVCVRLAHHLPAAAERERLLRELLRVSDRFVLLTYFDFDSVKNRIRRARQRFDGKKPKITMKRADVARLAAEGGFEVVASRPLSRLFSGHRYALMVRS